MTESDQTWNAAGEGTPPTPPAQESPWPQYSWPAAPTAPAADPTAELSTEDLEPLSPAAPYASVNPGWSPAAQTPPAPSATPGYTGPNFSAPGAPPAPPAPPHGAGGWGTPPAGPGGWGTPPAAPSQSSQPGKKVLAIFAAIMLVIASAGVGAAVALAVHGNNKAQSFSSAPTSPFTPTNPNSGGGSGSNTNPFGGLGGNGGSGNSSGSSSSGSLDLTAIAAKVDPAMVNINTTLSNGRAAGSGMVIGADGEILTNNHVIADATSISVTFVGTGQTKPAHVVGYDVQDDVALVKVDGVSGLPTITFGDPSKVQVGDPVAAIGNALGKGGTPSAVQGEVTALDQQVTAGDPGGQTETLHHMIQTNAPIQPGDSGGALINDAGQIIGMNTAAAGGRFQIQSGSNVGFAIQIDNAIGIVHEIQNGNESNGVHIGPRGLLGVQVVDVNDPNAAANGNLPSQVAPVNSGALITGVQGNTGANDAGLKAGDVITSVDGKSITDSNGLHLALTVYHAGDTVKVSWVDTSGQSHDSNVKLVEGPPA